jgi:hypothetical protein
MRYLTFFFTLLLVLISQQVKAVSPIPGPHPMQNPSIAPSSIPVPLLCPNVCESGMMIQQKLDSGTCKPASVASCFPFRCNGERTLCDTSCKQSSECATGAYCDMAIKQCVAGNNCPSKCSGDMMVEYIRKGMMCVQNRITSCFPYGCDQQAGTCGYACMSDQQCAPGAMCSAATKSCVPAFSRCDKDEAKLLVLPDGTKTACDPYMCRGNSCMTNCAVSTDCAPGFVCDSLVGRCIKP